MRLVKYKSSAPDTMATLLQIKLLLVVIVKHPLGGISTPVFQVVIHQNIYSIKMIRRGLPISILLLLLIHCNRVGG